MKNLSSKMIAMAALSWFTLSAIVKISANPSLWGLLPFGTQCIWWVLPASLACIVLFGAVLIGREISLLDHRFDLSQKFARLLAALGGIVLLAAGWMLRSRNHFMGDGWAFISNVSKDYFLRENEPLDFFLHQFLQRGLSTIGFEESVYAYWLPHVILLPVYVFILWKLACLIADKPPTRTAVFALLSSTGTLQLFFGYVESYTFMNLMLALYFLTALRQAVTPSPASLLLPTVILVLAAGFHLSAIIFIPSLLYFWLEALHSRKDNSLIGFNSILILSLMVVGASIVLLFINTDLILPLGSVNDRAYSLLSQENIWDKLNLLTFVLPYVGIVLLLFLFESSSIIRHRNHRTVFLVLAASCALGFVLVFDPLLGIRDWDIIAIAALPLALLGAWMLSSFLPKKVGLVLITGLALGSCAHLGTLLSINSVERRGVTFLQRQLVNERHDSDNLLQLSFIMELKGYEQEALNTFKHALESPKAQKYIGFRFRGDLNLAYLYIKLGYPQKALTHLIPHIEILSELSEAHKKELMLRLLVAYDLNGQPYEATKFFLTYLKEGRRPNQHWLKYLIENNKIAEFRNRYWLDYKQDTPDAGVLMFYIRYYSLEYDNQKLDEIYRKVVNSYLSLDQWETFIRLAKLSKHGIHDGLIYFAVRQYPNQAARFKSLVE